MKQCSKCEEWKPFTCYYNDNRKKDGKVSECKDCWKAREREKYNEDSEIRHRKSEWAKTERDKIKHSEYNKLYTKTDRGKEVQRNGGTNYRKKFPERIRAKNLVHYYIRQGKIPSASTQICQCGKQATDYHHPNYSKPLEVIALCRNCHLRIHKEMNQ